MSMPRRGFQTAGLENLQQIIEICTGASTTMRIFVKTPDANPALELEVDASDDIEHVKYLIMLRLAIPVELQRLIYSGRRLEGCTLGDYGIQRDSTLYMLLRLSGD